MLLEIEVFNIVILNGDLVILVIMLMRCKLEKKLFQSCDRNSVGLDAQLVFILLEIQKTVFKGIHLLNGKLVGQFGANLLQKLRLFNMF